ncbi:MAG: acyltransferase family protein [Lachnospiraceae bacterium]
MKQNADIRKYFSKDVTFTAKGIAIILMLIHHLFCCFPEWYDTYHIQSVFLTKSQVMNLSVLGKICVSVFIFLSAYGMTVGFEQNREKDLWDTAKRRYIKLAGNFGLVFYLSILTCWLRADRLSIYGWEIDKKRAIWNMVVDALGLANFLGTPTYNETWWYMSVAIFMIFFIPILYKIYGSCGKCLLPVSAMASMLGIATNGAFTTYLFASVLGIYMAKDHIIDRIDKVTTGKRGYLYLIGGIVFFVVIAKIRLVWEYTYWMDAILAVLLVFLVYLLNDVLHLRLRGLVFLGKHSMNMFLIHTLIFEYYFSDFIYSFRYWFLITAALVVTSLVGSILIEYLKKALIMLSIFNHSAP